MELMQDQKIKANTGVVNRVINKVSIIVVSVFIKPPDRCVRFVSANQGIKNLTIGAKLLKKLLNGSLVVNKVSGVRGEKLLLTAIPFPTTFQ